MYSDVLRWTGYSIPPPPLSLQPRAGPPKSLFPLLIFQLHAILAVPGFWLYSLCLLSTGASHVMACFTPWTDLSVFTSSLTCCLAIFSHLAVCKIQTKRIKTIQATGAGFKICFILCSLDLFFFVFLFTCINVVIL